MVEVGHCKGHSSFGDDSIVPMLLAPFILDLQKEELPRDEKESEHSNVLGLRVLLEFAQKR